MMNGITQSPDLATLIKSLRSPDYRQLMIAANTLHSMGPRAALALPSLCHTLPTIYHMPPPAVSAVIDAIGSIGRDPVRSLPALQHAFLYYRSFLGRSAQEGAMLDAAHAIGAFGGEAKPFLEELLKTLHMLDHETGQKFPFTRNRICQSILSINPFAATDPRFTPPD